ncbi:MAG: glycosyltransferase family 2 protein [Labilithrix sp.]|nr:glycosyltransferase family 2 protein [Labilithrix sp.]
MLNDASVVVVVPACQEEEHVGRVIATMPSFVDHIVVVDDGSTDRTSEVALGVADPRVELVRHPRRRGVGAAIASGYRAGVARTERPSDVLCVMAGDGQMDPADLEAVARPIVRGEAEYVKGDRFGYPGVRRSMGLPRWIGGQIFSRLTSLAIGQPVSDSQCGYTALSRAAAIALDLDEMWPGFGYPNDLLGLLAAAGMRVVEVPVKPVYGTETSKLRMRHLPPIFYLIGRAAVRRRRNVT